MIVDIVAHGRTPADTARLVTHLLKTDGQRSEVVQVEGLCADTIDEATAEMEFLRDASACTVAIQHIALSPRIHLTSARESQMCDAILDALDARDHGYVLVAHRGKHRALPGGASTHYHMVLAHVGPSLRGIDTSWTYPRLEAAARRLEALWGEELTPSRHARTVAGMIEADGDIDLADRIRSGIGVTMPRAGMSKRSRARAERAGIDLPTIRRQVREAYERSDDRTSFDAALSGHGLRLVPGRVVDVYVVMHGEQVLGAVDRMVDRSRKDVIARMREPGTIRRPEAPKAWHGTLSSDPVLTELQRALAEHASGWFDLAHALGNMPDEELDSTVDALAIRLAHDASADVLTRVDQILTRALGHIDRHGGKPEYRSAALHLFAAGLGACLQAVTQALERHAEAVPADATPQSPVPSRM